MPRLCQRAKRIEQRAMLVRCAQNELDCHASLRLPAMTKNTNSQEALSLRVKRSNPANKNCPPLADTPIALCSMRFALLLLSLTGGRKISYNLCTKL